METEKSLQKKELYDLALRLVNFPYAQVCKHHAAIEVLETMQRLGFELNKDLVRAIVEADDDTANEILGGS